MKTKNKTDEILEVVAKNLTAHLKVIMAASGKKISDEEADNLMSNVGMYILNKRLKNEINNPTN